MEFLEKAAKEREQQNYRGRDGGGGRRDGRDGYQGDGRRNNDRDRQGHNRKRSDYQGGYNDKQQSYKPKNQQKSDEKVADESWETPAP